MKNPNRKSTKSNVKTISIEEVLGQVDKADVKETNIDNLNESPLLNSPIVDKGYTSRDNQEQEKPSTGYDPMHKPSDPVGQNTAEQVKAASATMEQEEGFSMAPELSEEFKHIPDVPRQEFTTPPSLDNLSGSDGQSTPMPVNQESSEPIDKMVEEASSSLADTMLTMYETGLPAIFDQVVKIKKRVIKEHVKAGDLEESVIDDIDARNKENLGLFKQQAKQDVKMMEKPLKKLMAKKGIQAPPHVELIIVVAFVAAMNLFLFMSVKKDNEALLNKLSSKIRARKDEEVPYAEVEDATKK